MARWKYSAWGLIFDSELELPGVPSAQPSTPAAVRLTIGDVPASLGNPTLCGPAWQASVDRYLVTLGDTPRGLVEHGDHIRLTAVSTARIDLLETCISVLLHQRKLPVLRGVAVARQGRATVLVGGPCHGLSTLAAELIRRGYALMSDGYVAVRVDPGGTAWALPGFPWLKLWRDALERLEWPVTAHRPIRQGVDKFLTPVPRFAAGELPIDAVYVVNGDSHASSIRTTAVCGQDSLRVLVRVQRQPRLARESAASGEAFQVLASVAVNVPVTMLEYPRVKWTFFNACVEAIDQGRR